MMAMHSAKLLKLRIVKTHTSVFIKHVYRFLILFYRVAITYCHLIMLDIMKDNATF